MMDVIVNSSTEVEVSEMTDWSVVVWDGWREIMLLIFQFPRTRLYLIDRHWQGGEVVVG